MQKRVLIIFLLGVFLISFVSAQFDGSLDSFGDLLDTIPSSTMILGALFIIFFAVTFFIFSKVFTNKYKEPNKGVASVVSLAASLLMVYGINKMEFDFEGFLWDLGFSNDILSTAIPLIILAGLIFLFITLKSKALFILGGLFILLTFTDLIYEKVFLLVIGIALIILGLWLTFRKGGRRRNRSNWGLGGTGGSPRRKNDWGLGGTGTRPRSRNDYRLGGLGKSKSDYRLGGTGTSPKSKSNWGVSTAPLKEKRPKRERTPRLKREKRQRPSRGQGFSGPKENWVSRSQTKRNQTEELAAIKQRQDREDVLKQQRIDKREQRRTDRESSRNTKQALKDERERRRNEREERRRAQEQQRQIKQQEKQERKDLPPSDSRALVPTGRHMQSSGRQVEPSKRQYAQEQTKRQTRIGQRLMKDWKRDSQGFVKILQGNDKKQKLNTYKKILRKYHPDVNSSDPTAADLSMKLGQLYQEAKDRDR